MEPKEKPKRRKKRIKVCFLRVEDLSEESRKRLYTAARACQEATNRVWQSWEHTMLSAGRDAELRGFLGLYDTWKKAGTGEKPTLAFAAIDPTWTKRVTADLRMAFPTLLSRVVTLIVGATCRRIISLPSRTCGKLKLWQAVLLSRESPCRSFSILPIPFDKRNASLTERPEDNAIALGIRVERYDVPDRVNGESFLESMRLRIEGRAGGTRYAQWAVEAARGERPWAGSQLVYNGRKRRWFVALGVEVDPPPALPKLGEWASLTAPVAGACWLLKSEAREVRIGSGRRLEHLRNRLRASRLGTNSDPFGAPSRTGHGRKRRHAAAGRREGKWGRSCKTLNRQAVARVVKELGVWGATRLDYHVPATDCLLNTAGKEIGLPAWPIYQFSDFLRQTCADQGIELRILTGDSTATGGADGGCDKASG